MMRHHLILRVAAAFLAPAIILFALYVQFHGEVSPGGGFQAGAIFATAFILYALVFGLIATRHLLTMLWLKRAMAAGALLYTGTGMAGIVLGGAFLDYAPFAETAQTGRHIGIFLIEMGVGITVAAVMCAVFHAFAARPPQIADEEW